MILIIFVFCFFSLGTVSEPNYFVSYVNLVFFRVQIKTGGLNVAPLSL